MRFRMKLNRAHFNLVQSNNHNWRYAKQFCYIHTWHVANTLSEAMRVYSHQLHIHIYVSSLVFFLHSAIRSLNEVKQKYEPAMQPICFKPNRISIAWTARNGKTRMNEKKEEKMIMRRMRKAKDERHRKKKFACKLYLIRNHRVQYAQTSTKNKRKKAAEVRREENL